MNILLAENQTLSLEGFKSILSQTFAELHIMQAGSLSEIPVRMKLTHFDLVILDINISGSPQLKDIRNLVAAYPSSPILIHAACDEMTYAIPYLKAGARGFVSRTAPLREISKAIKIVSEGKSYVSAEVQEHLLSNPSSAVRASPTNSLSTLSQNEFDIMKLLMEGKMTKQVAIMMNLKENTISTYKKRIFQKMQVNNLMELSRKTAAIDMPRG